MRKRVEPQVVGDICAWETQSSSSTNTDSQTWRHFCWEEFNLLFHYYQTEVYTHWYAAELLVGMGLFMPMSSALANYLLLN